MGNVGMSMVPRPMMRREEDLDGRRVNFRHKNMDRPPERSERYCRPILIRLYLTSCLFVFLS